MTDLASIIGGNPLPTGDGTDPGGAWAYLWTEGDKFLELGASGDQLFGRGNDGDFTVLGGSGDDSMLAGRGDDHISGGRDNDIAALGRGADTGLGGSGDDTIYGNSDGDELRGGDGGDALYGGRGADDLDGGRGNDTLVGGADDDDMHGGANDDVLYGGDGDDTMVGGQGDDTLDGGRGDDALHGGPGDDVFYFDSNFGSDVITDLAQGDEIWLKAGLNNSGISSAADVASHVTGGVENGVSYTLITIGGDTIRIENMEADAFTANIGSWVKIQ